MAKAVNSPQRSRLLPTQPWKVCRSGRSRKCHESVTLKSLIFQTPWHRAERLVTGEGARPHIKEFLVKRRMAWVLRLSCR
ncbi:hypothetical protein CapIbe_014489 [Capra ibex]